MKTRYLTIKGRRWYLVERSEKDEPRLKDCDGFCDWTSRTIVIERELEGNLDDMERYIAKVKRHEIVHAFLLECGLAHSSSPTEAWATNEEMVDWLAFIGPELMTAWAQAEAER